MWGNVTDDHGNTQIIPTGKVWEDILQRYTSRKFVLVVFIQAIGALALLKHIIDGGVYVALSTLVLSTYFAGSVMDKKLNGTS